MRVKGGNKNDATVGFVRSTPKSRKMELVQTGLSVET
jgi:hypothetical protein